VIKDGHKEPIQIFKFYVIEKFLKVGGQMTRMREEFFNFLRPESSEMVGIKKSDGCVVFDWIFVQDGGYERRFV